MSLLILKGQDRSEVARLLADYWKERGMPEYDQKWAEEYLAEGHKKEIKQDEFFVFKEDDKLIGTVSLITDVSNIAEIRDLVVKPEYREKGFAKKIIEELLQIVKQRKIRKLFALAFPKTQEMLGSLGFEKEGLLKSHFAPGEDLVIMSKFL